MYLRGLICKESGDIPKSCQLFAKAAESGNIDAQFELGNFYTENDSEKSIFWYTKAAEQGDQFASLFLAVRYMFGHLGVEEDIQEAVKWFKMAAEQGEVNAQYILNLFYLNGYGVSSNTEKAKEWLMKAKANDQEPIDRQLQLGVLTKINSNQSVILGM